MAAYLDTSVRVALFFHEDASAAARARAGRKGQLWVSRWTLAEFAGAVAYKRCSAQTNESTALRARSLASTGPGVNLPLVADPLRCAYFTQRAMAPPTRLSSQRGVARPASVAA
jgi:predicted nucleic acid-binding protein